MAPDESRFSSRTSAIHIEIQCSAKQWRTQRSIQHCKALKNLHWVSRNRYGVKDLEKNPRSRLSLCSFTIPRYNLRSGVLSFSRREGSFLPQKRKDAWLQVNQGTKSSVFLQEALLKTRVNSKYQSKRPIYYTLHLLSFVVIRHFNVFLWQRKTGFGKKLCGMQDSREKGAGMWDQN